MGRISRRQVVRGAAATAAVTGGGAVGLCSAWAADAPFRGGG